jgi:lipoprotein-anchoring transpeptidase ErfK/SrfK
MRDLAAEKAADDAAHHRALVEAAHAALDAGPWEGARMGATNFVTSVLSAPLWPEDADGGQESVRLGYLRHGARLPVIPDPIVNDSCPDGWLELAAGGFVCGKNATLDPKNPRVRLAPHGPDLTRSLPYDYGVNIANGTPLYRRVLSIDDRKKYEPWLSAAPRPVLLDAGTTDDDTSDPLDAGALTAALPVEVADAAPLPWYLRDGGSKEVTLEDLHGHGVLVRRMVRGFVLALDRDFKAAHAHWWRTTAGFAVPFERVVVHHPPPEFRGAWLGGHEDEARVEFGGDAGAADAVVALKIVDASDDASARVPGEMTAVGFVRTSSAHSLTVDVDKKKVAWGAPLEKRSVVELTDATYDANGATYRQTTRGTWVAMGDIQLATPSPPPADLGEHEKWIDVDLTHQSLVAFEGTRPVFATLVASGKRDAHDKTKDHPTPTGTFRIQAKHVSATMDGNIAADAPYSIEDVPWVMYFDGSYALHGAFWHSNFGHTMSHGCVNLSPADARSLFAWTEPRLPDGWHGVFTRDPKDGTRVVVHE